LEGKELQERKLLRKRESEKKALDSEKCIATVTKGRVKGYRRPQGTDLSRALLSPYPIQKGKKEGGLLPCQERLKEFLKE